MDEKEAEARPVMGTIFLVIYTLTSLIRTPQNRAFLCTGHHFLVNFLLTSSKTHLANLLTHHIAAEGR